MNEAREGASSCKINEARGGGKRRRQYLDGVVRRDEIKEDSRESFELFPDQHFVQKPSASHPPESARYR